MHCGIIYYWQEINHSKTQEYRNGLTVNGTCSRTQERNRRSAPPRSERHRLTGSTSSASHRAHHTTYWAFKNSPKRFSQPSWAAYDGRKAQTLTSISEPRSAWPLQKPDRKIGIETLNTLRRALGLALFLLTDSVLTRAYRRVSASVISAAFIWSANTWLSIWLSESRSILRIYRIRNRTEIEEEEEKKTWMCRHSHRRVSSLFH